MNTRNLVAGALLAGALAGCGVADGTKANNASAAAEELATAAVPAPIYTGVCIDGTDSVGTALATQTAEAIAVMLEQRVATPTVTDAAVPPVGALFLDVRMILGGSSLDPAGLVAHVDLPAIPGVIAKPDTLNPAFTEIDSARDEQIAAADAARADAQGKVATAATQLRGANWSAPSSEIYGCIEALARTVPGKLRRFAAVTDLDQTDTPQSGKADLTGTEILVVHVGADLGVLTAQADAATAQWKGVQGAENVTFTSPERVADDVPAFLTRRSSS